MHDAGSVDDVAEQTCESLREYSADSQSSPCWTVAVQFGLAVTLAWSDVTQSATDFSPSVIVAVVVPSAASPCGADSYRRSTVQSDMTSEGELSEPIFLLPSTPGTAATTCRDHGH